MTIAQNVFGVASNWSGGAVGSGYIYSGHNDNDPAYALQVTDTSNCWSDTNDSENDFGVTNWNLGDGSCLWQAR